MIELSYFNFIIEKSVWEIPDSQKTFLKSMYNENILIL